MVSCRVVIAKKVDAGGNMEGCNSHADIFAKMIGKSRYVAGLTWHVSPNLQGFETRETSSNRI